MSTTSLLVLISSNTKTIEQRVASKREGVRLIHEHYPYGDSSYMGVVKCPRGKVLAAYKGESNLKGGTLKVIA